MQWPHPWAGFTETLFEIKYNFAAQYELKQHGWIHLLCWGILLHRTYCRLNGDTKGRGDLKCSDPEQVPCPLVALPHSVPNSLASPTFGQAPLCRQTAASTFRLLSLSENFISFSTCGPAMAQHQHNHASERKQEYISELSRVGLLIYKVFSEAVI